MKPGLFLLLFWVRCDGISIFTLKNYSARDSKEKRFLYPSAKVEDGDARTACHLN